MRILHPSEIWPSVQIANYCPVRPGQKWGPRRINDFELILIVNGQFHYQQDDGAQLDIHPGEVLCIPPDVEQTFSNLGDGGVISCIHCDLLPSRNWATGDHRLDPAPSLVTPTGDDERLRELFPQCAELFDGYHPYRDALLQTIVREIWLRLAVHWTTAPARTSLSPRMTEMVAFLRANLHRPISRQELADNFALTPQHVNALFRKELGTSPVQFLHRERILQACRYIQIDRLCLTDAAARVGFQDIYYFSRVFKKVTGINPSQLR